MIFYIMVSLLYLAIMVRMLLLMYNQRYGSYRTAVLEEVCNRMSGGEGAVTDVSALYQSLITHVPVSGYPLPHRLVSALRSELDSLLWPRHRHRYSLTHSLTQSSRLTTGYLFYNAYKYLRSGVLSDNYLVLERKHPFKVFSSLQAICDDVIK
jgi:hypothetical protein